MDAVAVLAAARRRSHREGPVLNGHRCLVFDGARNGDGYAIVRVEGRLARLHRIALEQVVGSLGALFACHHCDNPPCFELAHLFPATNAENAADMSMKGRGKKTGQAGEENYAAKLTEADVRRIRSEVRRGRTMASLAREVGLTRQRVHQIVKGRGWAHVA